jgi:hypothetical protein
MYEAWHKIHASSSSYYFCCLASFIRVMTFAWQQDAVIWIRSADSLQNRKGLGSCFQFRSRKNPVAMSPPTSVSGHLQRAVAVWVVLVLTGKA